MSVLPTRDEGQHLPTPRKHAIGFAESIEETNQIISALNDVGFPDSKIMVLSGEDGVHLLKRMMRGSLWGETAEDVLREGVAELSHGHFVLVVETEDRDEAVIAANIAASHGGHNFNYFGTFQDVRLTK